MEDQQQELDQVADDGRYLLDSTWQRQQEKTFTAWCNSHLRKLRVEISKIDEDFRDGLKLMLLLELISGDKIGKPEKKKIRFHYINNVQKSLNFIRDHGVRLVGIGAEEIVDGNLKMTLGMIWTLILRFSIQDISVGERSAKEGLLLWCQKKTKPYKNVNVQNFHMSWKDGLAFCALIHRHRPELIDYDSLRKDDPLTNLNTAFEVAEKHLDIPKMLEAEDLVNTAKPDERSVMTYVACYYHAFSDAQKAEKASDRICKVLKTQKELQDMIEDYERLASDLLAWINAKCPWLENRDSETKIENLQERLNEFRDYRRDQKPPKAQEKGTLESDFNTLQTKLRLSNRPSFVPSEGHMVSDIANAWKRLEKAEKGYEEWLTSEIRRLESLENLANKFHHRVKMHQSWTEGKMDLLKSEDYVGCNLQQIKAMLKKHEATESDIGAHQGRVEKINEIAESLCNAMPEYHDRDNVNTINQSLCDEWNALGSESEARKIRIKQREEELEVLEKLKLEYAKRATQFNNWMMSALEDLEDTFSVNSIEEIEQLITDHAAFKDSNGSAEDEKKSIVAYSQNEGVDYDTGNDYTAISPKEIDSNWDRIQGLVVKRDGDLAEELENQKNHEKLRRQFAEMAELLGPKLREHNEKTVQYAVAAVPEEDIQKNLEDHQVLCQQIEPEVEALEAVHLEVSNSRVYDNPHTAYTMEHIRVEWMHLKTSVSRTISEVQNQILLRDAKVITSEQMQEYRQSFNHFDKDHSGELNYDEMSGCLTSLGYEIDRSTEEGEKKFAEIMKRADPTCRDTVTLDGFIDFMIQENQDTDTADQIIDSFKVIAGDKPYITADQLRQELPPDEAEYCIGQMAPYTGQGTVDGALDYKSFSTALYGESDL